MKSQPIEISQYYHYFNRSNNKELIFREKENYVYFLRLINKYILPIAEIYSYCLLPNHFHFILRIKDSKDLPEKYQSNKSKISQPFSNLFNAYTKAYNKKYGRKGSLFQKHPKHILITNENYLRNLIVYVNCNPSHHNIENFDTYSYSSHKALLSNLPTKIIRTAVIDLFDTKENLAFVLKNKHINMKLLNDLDLE
ncbi:MAG: transposase [Flavobacteriaceae bacterium]|nr:transposase [Flavobacteriaceae bacterium]